MKIAKYIIIILCSIFATSCEKFIEIDTPRTDLIKSTVFTSDATANAAMIDIYFNMNFNGFASGSANSLTYLGSVGSDDLIDYTSNGANEWTRPFFENNLRPTSSAVITFWDQLYSWIYKSNNIIEGLTTSTGVSQNYKNQLLGEAKFIRAFCHFYLVNLWGDVPLILTSDYRANAAMARTPTKEVFQQVVTDLKDAQTLLANDYSFSGNERTRPNKWAATAMLARTYLYVEEWSKAEEEATKIINNTATYSLSSDLTKIFSKSSKEAIWQFKPRFNFNNDIATFYAFSGPPTWGALRPDFVNSFEAADQRKIRWLGQITGSNSQIYYFPLKYNSFTPQEEYSTLFRLAEQYLIRAEARAKQNKLTGSNSAETDINTIRNRAGLPPTTATTQADLLDAIGKERKFELFTEWGHRWLDLKRTNRIDQVMAPLKPEWKSTAKLYPIPEAQILNSPVVQNPGY